MSEVDTAIITAVASEAKPIAARLGLAVDAHTFAGSPAWSGKVNHHSVILTATGMGRQRATEATEALLERCPPKRVVIAGLSGALDPQLAVGDIILPHTLIDAVTGKEYAHETEGETHRLLTVDTVIDNPAAKAKRHQEHGAALVDMESAVIAALCESKQVPWQCIRAVLDTANETLPAWLGGCVDRHGKAKPIKTLVAALVHPLDWPAFIRTARHVPAAANALADAVAALLGGQHDAAAGRPV